MVDVIIAGIGQTPVGEHWDISLRTLANQAIQDARRDAARNFGAAQSAPKLAKSNGAGRSELSELEPQALYIGNLLGHTVSHQANLGALLTANSGLEGIESFTIEAAEASGASAFHMAYLAVASGMMDVALVVGVDKYTDLLGPAAESAVAEMIDYDYEAVQGLTPAAQAGLLMQRYLYEYALPRDVFAGFPILAHANAVNNPNAMYRRAIKPQTYASAPAVSEPLNLMDVAPYADGAAAALLVRSDLIQGKSNVPKVRVTGSSVVTDRLALHDRPDMLSFEAAGLSVERACRQAGCMPGDMDLFELWDGFSIYAALSLEAACFASKGAGWRMVNEGRLGLSGELPALTMGGQKARGNPLGAASMYQLVEAAVQLRGQAGANQVSGAQRALVQALGGPASTAVTHILERMDE